MIIHVHVHDLACFFLPSFSSLIKTCIHVQCTCIHVQCTCTITAHTVGVHTKHTTYLSLYLFCTDCIHVSSIPVPLVQSTSCSELLTTCLSMYLLLVAYLRSDSFSFSTGSCVMPITEWLTTWLKLQRLSGYCPKEGYLQCIYMYMFLNER